MRKRTGYHLNVLGDFYVEDGCCTSCGVPEHFAPDLLDPGRPDEQCFVKKQPDQPDELARMMEVFATQDVQCIRYAGQDHTILRTLKRMGEGGQCDHRIGFIDRIMLRFGKP